MTATDTLEIESWSLERLVQNSSRNGSLVWDGFACENTERHVRAIEREPRNADVMGNCRQADTEGESLQQDGRSFEAVAGERRGQIPGGDQPGRVGRDGRAGRQGVERGGRDGATAI